SWATSAVKSLIASTAPCWSCAARKNPKICADASKGCSGARSRRREEAEWAKIRLLTSAATEPLFPCQLLPPNYLTPYGRVTDQPIPSRSHARRFGCGLFLWHSCRFSFAGRQRQAHAD